jgi:hypothetical protein
VVVVVRGLRGVVGELRGWRFSGGERGQGLGVKDGRSENGHLQGHCRFIDFLRFAF